MSGHLLLDERPVVLQPSLVRRLGILDAAVVQQLHYWAQRATHVHVGEVWVYKTYQAWADEIGVTAKAARGALDRLRTAGVVVSMQNPTDPHDRTLWWRVDYSSDPAFRHAPTGRSNSPDGDAPSAPTGRSRAGVSMQSIEHNREHYTESAREARPIMYRRKRVPDDIAEAAHAAVMRWAERTRTTGRFLDGNGALTESGQRVVGAMTTYPEVVELWPRMIDAALAAPWWDGPATIGVVFGPKVVEQSIARAQTPAVAVNGAGPRVPRRNGRPTAADFLAAGDRLAERTERG